MRGPWGVSLFMPQNLVYSTADIWINCAFDDRSMKFGTLLEYNLIKIFGYRAIADFPWQKWQPFSKTATIGCYSIYTFDMVD